MYTLEKQKVNRVDLGNDEIFEDAFFVKVFEGQNKQEIRRFIKKKYNDEGVFRMIAPGGAVSNPLTIKLQEEGKRHRPDRVDRLKHRICDDYDPIVIPTTPLGRMRLIAKALREE